MKKNMYFFMVIIVLIISTVGCANQSGENEHTSQMNRERTIFLKHKKVDELDLFLEAMTVNEPDSASEEGSEVMTLQKETHKEDIVQENNLEYTIEKVSEDFMPTVSLNVREGPGTDFKLVGSFAAYEKVVASEKTIINGSTWYKVTAEDITGWSSANYLVIYEKSETPAQATKEKVEEKQTEPSPNKTEETTAKAQTNLKSEKPTEAPSTSATPSAIEKAVIDLTNAERKKVGLAPFKIDNNVVASAREKSNDMSTNNYFSHTSPTYGSVDSQLTQFGVSFSGWAENIAQGQPSAEQVVEAWMNSPGHKDNILHSSMTHIGVGFDANGNYWTQQFIYK